jgi:NTP-dependent ternary system trypsin peptidase co-occuring protein
MPNLIEVPLEKGGSILIEADASGSGEVLRGRSAAQVIERVSQTLEEALSHVRSTADVVITQLCAIPQTPEEVSVEFGIKFGAKGSVYIAGGEAEANFKVALKWKKENAPAEKAGE